MNNNLQKGLIMRSTGSWYEILDGQSKIRKGRLKGKLRLKGYRFTNPIAVGDYVDFELEDEDENTVAIVNIHERKNYIVRQSTRKKYQGHIISSNLDLAIVIATLAMPRTSLGFIDRFLVAAESSNVPAAIFFNKSDLLDSEGIEFLEELCDLYESLGYQTLIISALEKQNLEEAKEMVRGKVSLVAGHSGVGKSTLLNALVPNLEIRTKEISTFANKGVHTTTFAEMFEIMPETYLIDTPGIKELGIIGLGENEITFYFPELKALVRECKFNNCTHTHEPGCKVLEALENGEIAPTRYHSYLSILEGYDNRR